MEAGRDLNRNESIPGPPYLPEPVISVVSVMVSRQDDELRIKRPR
jgi:hypothetical protein